MSPRTRGFGAILRPTSGSLSGLAESARPSVAMRKIGSRLEWLNFRRRIDVVPYGGLERLGTSYGGYVVPTHLIAPEWVCYSAGLGEDISFELELIRRFGCTVDAFDPTPKSIEYVSAVAKTNTQLHFHPYGLWGSDSGQRFYTPRDPSHVSHSIENLQGTSDFILVECRSVPSLLTELGHDTVDLLKLDVEGAEYAVLNSLLEAAIRPSVLCVDFHKTTTIEHMAGAVDRLRELDLRPVYVYRTDVTLVAGRHFS